MNTPPYRGFVSADLEPEARRLYSDACAGGAAFLSGLTQPAEALKAPATRRAFVDAVHSGFARAQELVGQRLLQLQQVPPKARDGEHHHRELLYRKAMDSVAWQILSLQLYAARRFYAGRDQPTLAHSNFEAVKLAATQIAENHPQTFALINDLTTFVQIGDLLVIDMANGALQLVEVKEGEKNRQVAEFADFFVKSRCAYALKAFREREGEKTFQQLGRVLRQVERMKAVVKIMNEGTGTDPLLKMPIRIPENPVELDSYDDRLSELIERSDKDGWALDVIDECLFIGAYRSDARAWGHHAFQMWLGTCRARSDFPVANLLRCMTTPLALPLSCRHIPVDHGFDVLFDRCRVFLAIHLEEFAKRAQALGLPLVWTSKKHARRLRAQGFSPLTVDGKAMVVRFPEAEVTVQDGIALRMLFHGTTPDSTITLLGQPVGEPPEDPETGGA
ncbi:MAG: hypothetical protein AMS25_09085 [Gemmatimonas sp. SM23_52]|nr:MAG: hypothetical protein AMS25_09085 [Gemmatimonas sp. SM23_52]